MSLHCIYTGRTIVSTEIVKKNRIPSATAEVAERGCLSRSTPASKLAAFRFVHPETLEVADSLCLASTHPSSNPTIRPRLILTLLAAAFTTDVIH